MRNCPRCDKPYEILPQTSDQLKGRCNGCGLSATATGVAIVISKYSAEDVLHKEMTKKAEMENAN